MVMLRPLPRFLPPSLAHCPPPASASAPILSAVEVKGNRIPLSASRLFPGITCNRLTAVEIELKGIGHEMGLVENLVQLTTGLKKVAMFYSDTLTMEHETGVQNSETVRRSTLYVKLCWKSKD